MREAGIQGLYRRRHRGCTVRDPDAQPSADLVNRRFSADTTSNDTAIMVLQVSPPLNDHLTGATSALGVGRVSDTVGPETTAEYGSGGEGPAGRQDAAEERRKQVP